MFFRTGYYDYRDDPISLAFLGLINRLLRSMVASTMILFASSCIAVAGIWNFAVDYYIVHKGVTEQAAVTNASRSAKNGYTVEFAYRFSDQRDDLRIVEPWFQDLSSGTGVCTLITDPRGCRNRGGTVNVVYLPEHPGAYVVKEDQLLFLARGALTTLALLIALGTSWNILRLGAGQPSLRLPSWSDWGFH